MIPMISAYGRWIDSLAGFTVVHTGCRRMKHNYKQYELNSLLLLVGLFLLACMNIQFTDIHICVCVQYICILLKKHPEI